MRTSLGEEGNFGEEATTTPGRPLDRRAGWVHLSPALGSMSRWTGCPGQPLFPASGCLSITHSHFPRPLPSCGGLGG